MAVPFSARLLERMVEERSQLAFQPIVSLDYLSPRGKEHRNGIKCVVSIISSGNVGQLCNIPQVNLSQSLGAFILP
jgi:hypothetical protein